MLYYGEQEREGLFVYNITDLSSQTHEFDQSDVRILSGPRILSPDGGKLAFSGRLGDRDGGIFVVEDLFDEVGVGKVEAKYLHEVDKLQLYVILDLAWSLDGMSLFVVATDSPYGRQRIFVLRPWDGQPVELELGEDFEPISYPVWSDDRKHMALLGCVPDCLTEGSVTDVRIVRIGDSGFTVMQPFSDGFETWILPRFSSDGKHVVFAGYTPSQDSVTSVRIVDLDSDVYQEYLIPHTDLGENLISSIIYFD